MEEKIIFTEKSAPPSGPDLKEALGQSYSLWSEIRDYVFERYPAAAELWSYGGIKGGWNFRIKDRKRAIIYLLPRQNYFKVSLVYGDKATSEVMESGVSQEIKQSLSRATRYMEGRGFSIEVKDAGIIPEIEKLIDIKLSN